jgi:hypothetical protein
MKTSRQFSKASGNECRKVFEIMNHCGRYSPRLAAKREAAARRRFSRPEAGKDAL